MPIGSINLWKCVSIFFVLIYGAQTWTLTNIQNSKLKIYLRAIEHSILGVKVIDRVRYTIVRPKTNTAHVSQKAAQLKWEWAAGHVALNWCPETVRRRGRPRRKMHNFVTSAKSGGRPAQANKTKENTLIY